MSACSASFLHIFFNISYVNAKGKKKGKIPAIVNCQNSAKWSCVCVAATNLGSTVSIQELSGASCTSPTLLMATHTD